MKSPLQILRDVLALARLPCVTIHLKRSAATRNDPFYLRLVDEFYATTQRRHPKLPFVRAMEYGVALCAMPATQEEYLQMIEASGRRNLKKAVRSGYRCERFDYNRHLNAIADIRRSADTRQGAVPDEWLNGMISECKNPVSRVPVHDYVYYGVFKDRQLAAFAGCFVCGEIAMIETLLGHAAHLAEGVVPALLAGMVRHIRVTFPEVRYYSYGTYYGGGETLRRFKKKFGFLPHRVKWTLE